MPMLEEADYGVTDLAMQREQSRYRGDENLYVRFFMHPIQDINKSREEGRPIFVDKEFVSIMVPGDKGNIVTRVARPDDINRFSRQYHAFKNNMEEVLEGTPLDKWNFITPAQVEEMRHFNIRTVEQLANLSDVHAQNFMGIQVLKRRAKEYIEATKADAPVAQLQAELEERDNKIASLNQALEELTAKVAAMGEED